ncbi:DUF4307 domain-containing protein, partial [Cellulomonas triticagri]|uniref:DUF4307 domain-containing protein n=1 Tax=Cellulomonas triticagri TaxID=2483352 RepID=UPI001F3AF3A3
GPADAPAATVPASPGEPPAGRYGRERPPGHRRVARALVAVLALVGLGITVWIGLDRGDSITWKDVGYRVAGSESVEITFDVTKDADATVRCRVQALSERYAEVGVQTVTVGPAGTATQRVTVTIPTAQEAVTAVVETCEAA